MNNSGKLSNKFLALGLVLALAVAVPIVPLLMGYSQQLADTSKEKSGVAVHRELRAVLQDIQRHRGASTAQLSGKAEFKERADKARAGVDAALSKSDIVFSEQQIQLAQPAAWAEFKRNWQQLKSDFISLKPAENARRHTALIGTLLTAMEEIADTSGLVLDPEMESFYLMDLAVLHLPPTTERMGQGRAFGSLILSEKVLDTARRDSVLSGVVEITLQQKGILTDGEKVFLANKETGEQLKGVFEAAKSGIATYKSNVETHILNAETLSYEPARFFDETTQAIDATFKLYDNAIAALDNALERRTSHIRKQRQLVLLISLALIALSSIMAFVTLRRVNRSIVVAAGALEQIAGGNLSLTLQPESNDELGALIVSIDEMQKQLAQRLEADKQAANETLRLKVALDVTSNSVMVADPDGTIIYCNAAVMAMMTDAESDLRKALPNFRASTIVGSNFDIYHKSPSHQRNMLGALTSTHRSEVKVGGRTFALVANPIINREGQRLGTVVEWLDRTTEVKIEADVAEIIHAASKGDFAKRLNAGQMSGFFKYLSEGINDLLAANTSALSQVGNTLSHLSKGNLTHKIDAEYEGMLGTLKDDANATVDQLREIVLSIKDAADAINTAAREISAGNQNLSSRTEEQASSLEETASSMEQLTSTVKQNADNANQASKLAIDAQQVAVEGGEVVSQVVQTMDAIHHASGRIADIIGVIDGIAFQTNILALNAAVEAARAGEQGRGFAVVATEVRNLAKRSADAAKEIKTLISDSVDKIESGNVLVNRAGQTMGNVVASIRKVSSIIGGISEASREQSAGIEQVSLAITQMDEVTQQNAALVEEAAAAAESLEEQADNLARAVAVFQMSTDERPALLSAAPRTLPEHSPKEAHKSPTQAVLAPPAASLNDEWAEF